MNKGMIDFRELNNTVEKIMMYKRQEMVSIDSIERSFKKINENTKLPFDRKLEDIEFELLNKLKLFKKMHENDEDIFNKNLVNYQYAEDVSKNIFENIYKG